MTTLAPNARPDTHDMLVAHRVFRRESALLPELVAAVAPGDVERARLIAAHLRDYQLGLHNHHSAEDELVWPLLLARVDLEAELVLRMEHQHEAVAATLDRVSATLPAWEAAAAAAERDELVAALRAHRESLLEHLGDEERYVLSLIEEHLTVAEWDRLGEHFQEHTPRNKLMFFLGAILEEATPQERAASLGELPWPARVLWYAVGQRAYRRRIRAIRRG